MRTPTHARTLLRRRLLWFMTAAVALMLAATQLPGLAQSTVDDPLPTVVFVARADNPVDALAASGVAGTLGGTVLLSDQNELSPATRQSLIDLDPDLVIIAGGTAALSAAVEQEIQAIPLVTQRVSGPTRIETAVALGGLAEQLGFGRPILTDATVEGDAGLAGTMSVEASSYDHQVSFSVGGTVRLETTDWVVVHEHGFELARAVCPEGTSAVHNVLVHVDGHAQGRTNDPGDFANAEIALALDDAAARVSETVVEMAARQAGGTLGGRHPRSPFATQYLFEISGGDADRTLIVTGRLGIDTSQDVDIVRTRVSSVQHGWSCS